MQQLVKSVRDLSMGGGAVPYANSLVNLTGRALRVHITYGPHPDEVLEFAVGTERLVLELAADDTLPLAMTMPCTVPDQGDERRSVGVFDPPASSTLSKPLPTLRRDRCPGIIVDWSVAVWLASCRSLDDHVPITANERRVPVYGAMRHPDGEHDWLLLFNAVF